MQALTKTSSYDDVAEAIVLETIRRGYTRDQGVPVLATAIQESGLRPSAVSPNGKWIGIYQQDTSYPGRADPNQNITGFLDRLDAKLRSPGASSDIWVTIFWLQQRPGEPSADAAYRNGRKAYLTEIQTRTAEAARLYDKYAGGAVPSVADNRPDFNEFAFFLSGNSTKRNVADVDLWLLHTQEPPKGSDNRNDAALELRNFLESTKGGANPVSYHYAGSMANDGGTTIVDCVDTDYSAWAVGNSNGRSINFCFAGTRSDWTRQQWLDNERGTIAAAAYLFVQDCAKYPKLKARVIAPNYSAPPGAADHNYCTKFLKDGNNHTDVGPNFPWDVFTADVAKYAGDAPAPPVIVPPAAPTDRELLEDVWTQLRGPGGKGWSQLGTNEHGQNLTLVDAVAELLDKVTGSDDRGKVGVRFD